MPRHARIDTLFLDAGGVLVVPNWDRVSETFARHGVTISGAALRRTEPLVKFDIDRSITVVTSSDSKRWSDYLEGVIQTAGVQPSSARDAAVTELRAYHKEFNLWEQVPADVVPALERLRSTGLKLAVASNANGTLHRCLERLGLDRYFDSICDSHIEGVEKPDPRFFHILLDRTSSRPETTLHVGDLYHVDVVGARNTGLQTLLLDRDDLYGAFEVERVRTLEEVAERLS